jgi:hypothetical protein
MWCILLPSCPHHRFINHRRNMSDTYSEIEKRIQQAVDEMRALESTPVIAHFARQYDVPYHRLHGRFYGTPAKSDLVPGIADFRH